MAVGGTSVSVGVGVSVDVAVTVGVSVGGLGVRVGTSVAVGAWVHSGGKVGKTSGVTVDFVAGGSVRVGSRVGRATDPVCTRLTARTTPTIAKMTKTVAATPIARDSCFLLMRFLLLGLAEAMPGESQPYFDCKPVSRWALALAPSATGG